MRPIDAESVLYYLIDEGQTNYKKYGFKLGDTIKFTPSQVDEIIRRRLPTLCLQSDAEYQDKEENDNAI